MEMPVRAKGGGVFNDHYDDTSRWTEEQAWDVAGHIVRQSRQDAEFVRTALAGWRSPDGLPLACPALSGRLTGQLSGLDRSHQMVDRPDGRLRPELTG